MNEEDFLSQVDSAGKAVSVSGTVGEQKSGTGRRVGYFF